MSFPVKQLLPVKSPKNLLQTSRRSGRMLSFFSSFVSEIPSSSQTLGKLSSTSPTICGIIKTSPLNKPSHDKINKMTCAPREDLDQPGQLSSLISLRCARKWVAKKPRFLRADSEDSDQTGHFVGFVMHWLIY